MTTTEFESLPALEAAEPRLGTLVMKFGGTSVADPDKIKAKPLPDTIVAKLKAG